MTRSEEEIAEQICSRLTSPANKLEGGFARDIINSVAYELANIENTQIELMLNRAFVTTATGRYLDMVGSDYGIERRESSPSIVELTITGNKGAIVNSSVKAIYNNLIFTIQEYKRIPEDGEVSVKAMCETKGTIGNVPADTITEFITVYEGLKTVNNPKPAYDGFDREDDETYRQRILDYLAEDATNANAAQYEKWAREVVGVQKAVVKSAEVMGAGNVGVYISAINANVSNELILAVKEHIQSVQPINATIIVNAMNYVDMNVDAKVVLKAGFDPYDIEEEFKKSFSEYLVGVDNTVSYFRVSEILFNLEGVEDVIEYTLNGGTESIVLADTDYPVVGECNVHL